ncbi:hypothetical protein PF011_g17914 [Phytophthora fragariae]|uniref:Uncharacterized protein n=3 Tax=Phytophthora fragariae TaxID=53985 RepID=A0A6A3E8T8_9STRA|nr:hypothetical protein PF009_g19950 [Phytophthora fragariae]KAE8991516.1 hypothetical protein PF011_g17914 [Phytophthora fragariae]
MSKYADWSPASVFGSTVATSMVSTAACRVERQSGPRTVSKSKVSPKKCDPTATSLPQDDSTRSNNNEESQEDKNVRVYKDARVEREKELAALLLQRQVQVWLLRRQETLRIQEVQRLRKELRHAAASVIRESYRRYTKRRTIGKYLSEVGKFETQLSALLQGCIARKRQMEEVQRFVAVRRQHEQLQKDRKRTLIHDWLTICMKTRRVKREEQLARAHSKLSGWVRRWTLRKRLEARVAAREIEKQRQTHRISSAQAIADFYRVCKLRYRAKAELLCRRRCRNGLIVLGKTFRMAVLRRAQSNWNVRVSDLKLADEAATKLQRVYRAHQVAARSDFKRLKLVNSTQQLL